MNTELKRQIIVKVFDNLDEFQIINKIIEEFSDYIYNKAGEYLIGGEEVIKFIDKIIPIIKEI